MDKAELLKLWFSEVWENGNPDAIDDLFAPEALADGVFTAMNIKRNDHKDFVQAALSLIGPVHTEITHSVEQGDWLAARLKFSTERADTGEAIAFTGQTMVRYRDGKMVQYFNQIDHFTLFEKLGQLPPEALAICLTGQRLEWV
jgi:predicted ester cyclase